MHMPTHTAAFAKCCAVFFLLLCALCAVPSQTKAQQPSPILQIGHSPQSLALSPDGRFAVTASYGDGLLKWWDSKTGLLMRSVVAHDGMISTVSFDASGGRILSGGADGFIRVWDAASARKLLEFRSTTGLVKHAVYNPHGNLIASCSFGFNDNTDKDASTTIQLWDARTGRLINTLRGHAAQVERLAFNPVGDTLLSASGDKTLGVWSVATGTLIRTIQLDAAPSGLLSFSPDGEVIAATTFTWNPTYSEIIFFNSRTGGRLRSFRDSDSWSGQTISANWAYFITASGQTFKVWDAESGRLIRATRREGNNYYSSVAADATGSVLAFAGGTSPLFLPSATLSGSQPEAPVFGSTTGLAVTKARRLVAWGSGSEAYIWDTSSAKLLHILKGHKQRINEVAFSPDGRILASCTNDEVNLWSTENGAPLGDMKVPLPGGSSEQYLWHGSQSVAFSPDGRLLATGELKLVKSRGEENVEVLGIRLWEVRTRRLLRYFKLPDLPSSIIASGDDYGDKGIPYWIRTITFSPDGQTIASDNGSERVLLLNVSTGRFRTLNGHKAEVNSVAYSTDGQRLVSASFDETVKVWNVATGRAIHTLKGHRDRVTTARFSPSGRVIVSGGLDRTVRLWDANKGVPISVLENHEQAVTFAAISPDGQTAFTTGLDGRVSIWSLPGKSLAATLLADSDGSWVCISPDGYYQGNDAEKYLGWQVGGQIFPASAYREQFSKPKMLLARLNGVPSQTSDARPTPTPSATVRPTPTPAPSARTTPPAPTERGGNIRMKAQSGNTYTVQVYKGSYALVIGNSDYASWTRLPGVYQDLNEVARALTRQDFQVVSFDERGEPLFGRPLMNLTRAEFNRQLELFVNEYGQDEENRLLIYYAGHGYTALLPDGRKMGYLVMRDAPPMPEAEVALERGLTYRQLAPFRRTSVNMDEMETFAKNITARHALFVFDSCFAGTVLFRDGGVAIPAYIGEDIIQPVREFLTAGNERQRVLDDSAFRKAFVRGIEGAADAADGDHPRDGYVLASELYLYVYKEVKIYTGGKQTPVFGKIVKQELARGDFVFIYARADR